MVIGILVGVVGVAMVVCSDLGELAGGKIIGYLLAFGAVICWNAFNFLTDKLTGDYKPLDIVLCQLLAAMLISAPYGLTHLPAAEHITADLIGSLLYLGIVGSCIGFVLYVNALAYIGVTPSALFTNLLPVITTLFAWLFLGEAISPLQLAGGLIVILSGCAVIWLKSRHELSLSGNTADEKHGD
jgi:probable blue pigment (indigoidine) exporter